MVKIFIGGFPLEMSELELVQLVSMHGTVVTIKIVRDKKTGICKGYAFLEMKSLGDAENVVEALNGRMLAGRDLSVKINKETIVPAAAPPRSPKAPRPDVARPPKEFTPNPIYKKVERPTGIVKKKRQRKQL